MTTPENIESVTPPSEPTMQEAAAEKIATIQADPLGDPAEARAIQERMAFETYANSTGQEIPSNFKDAGAWFDSLKEAQSNYTKGQQELAEMRQAYQDGRVVENPNFEAPAEPEPAPSNPEISAPELEELRIPDKPVEEAVPEPVNKGITEEMWTNWGQELAAKGSLSDTTRTQIRDTTGFTDHMIDDYVLAQKSRLREGFKEAGEIVGGTDNLNTLFNWASKELPVESQEAINIGLAGPSYEITLRGLNDMYQKAVQAEKKAEPVGNPNLTSVSSSETGLIAYRTQREFKQDRSNPSFATDPRFRDSVERRMLLTDFNHLPF
jgi:hypothetical protein